MKRKLLFINLCGKEFDYVTRLIYHVILIKTPWCRYEKTKSQRVKVIAQNCWAGLRVFFCFTREMWSLHLTIRTELELNCVPSSSPLERNTSLFYLKVLHWITLHHPQGLALVLFWISCGHPKTYMDHPKTCRLDASSRCSRYHTCFGDLKYQEGSGSWSVLTLWISNLENPSSCLRVIIFTTFFLVYLFTQWMTTSRIHISEK